MARIPRHQGRAEPKIGPSDSSDTVSDRPGVSRDSDAGGTGERARDQPRLRDVDRVRLDVRRVDRVHDLARRDVRDAREALRRGADREGPARRGPPARAPARRWCGGVVLIAEHELLALRCIECGERAGFQLAADLPHEVEIEAQVVDR